MLEQAVLKQQGIIESSDAFLRLIASGLTDAPKAEFFGQLSNLYLFRTWTPTSGTYDDLISSGRLLYLQNLELRRALSQFKTVVEEIKVFEGLQILNYYERQAPFLDKTQDVNFSDWSEDYTPLQSPFEANLSPFGTLEYWNLLTEWICVHVDVVTAYNDGIQHSDRVLELIEFELAGEE